MKGTDLKTPIKGKFMPNMDFSRLSKLFYLGYVGDTTIAFVTSVILKFPFPKTIGEKFVLPKKRIRRNII